MTHSTFDNSEGFKRVFRFYGDNVAIVSSSLRGGAVLFGETAYDVDVNQALIRDTTIEKVSDPMPAAILVHPGPFELVLENVDINGGGAGRWTSTTPEPAPSSSAVCVEMARPLTSMTSADLRTTSSSRRPRDPR